MNRGIYIYKKWKSFREQAKHLAQQDKLVTFGITPDIPHIGYGYIKRGSSLTKHSQNVGFEISEFVEKPDLVTAEAYVSSGDYFWNSGIFMFKASVYLQSLAQYGTHYIR